MVRPAVLADGVGGKGSESADVIESLGSLATVINFFGYGSTTYSPACTLPRRSELGNDHQKRIDSNRVWPSRPCAAPASAGAIVDNVSLCVASDRLLIWTSARC